MNTMTTSAHTIFVHVHVLYVTTAGLFTECEHAVNLTVGVAVAWLSMSTAKMALETARVNRAAARLSGPNAAVAPVQALAESCPQTPAQSLGRPQPEPAAKSLFRPLER